jgi:hypothetical protein
MEGDGDAEDEGDALGALEIGEGAVVPLGGGADVVGVAVLFESPLFSAVTPPITAATMPSPTNARPVAFSGRESPENKLMATQSPVAVPPGCAAARYASCATASQASDPPA